jgi:hypothetical protein
VKRKIGGLDEAVMKRIVRISARLAEDRGPSLEAYSEAKFVFDEVVKILKIYF